MHKIKLRPEAVFDAATWQERDIEPGIRGRWGRLIGGEERPEGEQCLQQVAFEGLSLDQAMAWMDGKGYRLSDLAFAEQWFDGSESGYVEREANLFAAGEYAERNLTVTPEDIEKLAASPLPIPIFVEHAESRFRLGEVTSLMAAGRWLKGRLKLFAEANALLERLGLRTLSVAISRGLDRVAEVSVVSNPRVPGAALFSGELVRFSVPIDQEEPMSSVSTEEFQALQAEHAAAKGLLEKMSASRNADLARLAALEEQLRLREAETTLERYADRVPPAARETAIQLLVSQATITFADGEKPLAEVFRSFLDALPTHFAGGVRGASPTVRGADSLTPAELEFQQKHFPDVDLAVFASKLKEG